MVTILRRGGGHSLPSGRGTLLAIRRGTDGRSLLTLTRYKAANIENEYSGAELAV